MSDPVTVQAATSVVLNDPAWIQAYTALGQIVVGLTQTALIAWGIWLISQSNVERKANTDVMKATVDVLQGVAETLRGHTPTLEIQSQALRQLLEERRPHQA